MYNTLNRKLRPCSSMVSSSILTRQFNIRSNIVQQDHVFLRSSIGYINPILKRNNNKTLSTPIYIQPQRVLNNTGTTTTTSWRFLSSSTGKDNSNNTTNKSTTNSDDDISKEIVLTPGEKLVAVSRLGWYFGLFSLAVTCAYFVISELFPSSGSPNSIFNNSLDIVRKDSQVLRRYGDSIKGYGRDHGGHREGRRNFVEHTEYVDKDDGSKRTRVRYNIEGKFGTAFVFAEVSNQMKSGEFVYILVQDKANGNVHTVIDNRSALVMQRLSSGNPDAMNAMSQLLSGNDRK